MAYFKHETTDINEQIIICDDVNTFYMLLSYFIVFEPTYSLSRPYVGRDFQQGEYNNLINADGTTVSDVMPWPAGDYYISNLNAYMSGLNESYKTFDNA